MSIAHVDRQLVASVVGSEDGLREISIQQARQVTPYRVFHAASNRALLPTCEVPANFRALHCGFAWLV